MSVLLLLLLLLLMMMMVRQSDEDMSVGTGGGGGDRSNLRLSEPLSVAMTLSLSSIVKYTVYSAYIGQICIVQRALSVAMTPLSPALHVHCTLCAVVQICIAHIHYCDGCR